MSRPLLRQPLLEQTAAHLREGFQSGRWIGTLPGVLQLAGELMISKQIVRSALLLLEQEGWIESGGNGRKRRIVEKRGNASAQQSLRIGIMLDEPLENEPSNQIKILLGVRHAIETSGHSCIFSSQYLSRLNDNLPRISRIVKAAAADAWIVCPASRTVLEWFIAQKLPVFALGGRFQGLPVASCATRLAPAIESAIHALLNHGHRRIVMLAPPVLRKPAPIPSLQGYLDLLKERGINTTDYNLPHFEETTESLADCLNSVFKVTPPTAVLTMRTDHCVALLSFLALRGLQVPRDVSMVYMHMDPVFRFRRPALDHFNVQAEEFVTRITRWINGVKKGKPDQRQVIFDAVYVPGGTVGPVKK